MASHSPSLWKRGLGYSEMAYLTQLVPRLTRIFKPTIYSNISFDESASLSSANAIGAWGGGLGGVASKRRMLIQFREKRK